MQDSRVKRGSYTGYKTQQARPLADSGLYNSNVSKPDQLHLDYSRVSKQSPRLVYKHSMVPTKRLLSLSFSRILGFEKICANPPLDVSQFTKVPIACCSCFTHCCQDPFIVRSASNSSTGPRFHSVCASVSMFTITDNCLFLFLFLFLFLGKCLNTTRASLQTSRPLGLHRSRPLRVHTKSECVRTRSADFAPDPSSACYHHLLVECGIHGPQNTNLAI